MEQIHGLRKGDKIKCADRNDLRKTLIELGREGYNAVVWHPGKHVLIITAEPQKDKKGDRTHVEGIEQSGSR